MPGDAPPIGTRRRTNFCVILVTVLVTPSTEVLIVIVVTPLTEVKIVTVVTEIM